MVKIIWTVYRDAKIIKTVYKMESHKIIDRLAIFDSFVNFEIFDSIEILNIFDSFDILDNFKILDIFCIFNLSVYWTLYLWLCEWYHSH